MTPKCNFDNAAIKIVFAFLLFMRKKHKETHTHAHSVHSEAYFLRLLFKLMWMIRDIPILSEPFPNNSKVLVSKQLYLSS